TPANGYQFTFEGNSVTCPVDPMPYRWGITVHDSHFGLIRGNVLYNWAGSGIVLEGGNETGNVVEGNFIVRVSGNGNRGDGKPLGSEGTGIWLHGPNNYIRDNV